MTIREQIKDSVRQLREKSLLTQNLYKVEKPEAVPLETRVEALENAILEMVLDD